MWRAFLFPFVLFATVFVIVVGIIILQTSPTIPDGITASLLPNVNQIAIEEYDVFIGYDPGSIACQQYLLERSIQRVDRRRRLSQESNERVSQKCKTQNLFSDHSDLALDRFLSSILGINPKNDPHQKKRLLEDDSFNVGSSNTTSNSAAEILAVMLRAITHKEARDVVLPLILDHAIQGKTVLGASRTPASVPLRSQRRQSPFFEEDIFTIGQKIEISSSLDLPERDAEDFVSVRWLKHVKLDQVSLGVSGGREEVERAMVPCVAFIERPENHVMEDLPLTSLVSMRRELMEVGSLTGKDEKFVGRELDDKWNAATAHLLRSSLDSEGMSL